MSNSILVSVHEDTDTPEWIDNVKPFIDKVLKELKYDGEEVSVLFCGDSFIRQLNSQYRHIDSATDVLSFEDGTVYEDESGTKWKSVGDIIISLDTLQKNAEYFETTTNEELKRLLVHGILHLNGMDHGEEHIEKGKKPDCAMLVLQEQLLANFSGEII